MSSEFFQRHKAGIFLLLYLTLSIVFLANRVDPYVKGIKSVLFFLVSPEVVYSGKFFNKLDSLKGRVFKLTKAEAEIFC